MSLEKSFLVIQGVMQLHKFLVDFRNDSKDEIQNYFNEDRNNYIINSTQDFTYPGVVVNENRRPGGRTTNEERDRRLVELAIRDNFRQAFVDHNIHRPDLNV